MLPGDRPGAVSILFDSPSHQRRVLTVVRAIERRQQLPAFRRELSERQHAGRSGTLPRNPMARAVTLDVTLSLLR